MKNKITQCLLIRYKKYKGNFNKFWKILVFLNNSAEIYIIYFKKSFFLVNLIGKFSKNL